jgi:hypothetical protein
MSTKVLIRCVIVLLVVLLSLLYGNSISVQRLREEIRFIAGYRNTYDFSIDYFAAHADNWRAYLKDYTGKPRIQYLEVGVFEGSSFVWVLENILTDPSARATAIDPFFAGAEEKFRKNLKSSGYENKATVIRGFSYDELPKLPKPRLI